MMFTDRRQSERFILQAPIPAQFGGEEVRLIDIGARGVCIAHDRPLARVPVARLTFCWDDEPIAVDCVVTHTKAVTRDGVEELQTGLSLQAIDAREWRALRRMLLTIQQAEHIEHLEMLVEASKLINSSIDADTLFASILSVARKELSVERGTLYFVDEKKNEIWSKVAGELEVGEIRLPIGKGIAGSVAATGEPVVLHDAYADERFDRSRDIASGYRTRSMLCVPIRNREDRIVGVLQLLNKRNGSFGERDLRFLDAISDHMAIAMENATLHLELVGKQRMARELQLGREIQNGLLRTPPSDIPNVDLAAMSLPCFEVGGDYYDFVELPDGSVVIVIADVSGKGVSAALIMSCMQAALRLAVPIESDLAMLVARLNGLIFRSAGGRKYVTAFIGRYVPATGQLHYVNAGHNPPLIAQNGSLTKLASTGRPVGILPDTRYETASASLEPGGSLFLFTDGLNEAENGDEAQFGNERLEDLVRAAAHLSAGEMAAHVLRTVTSFEDGTAATDDKTIVVMRRVAQP